MQFLGLDLNLIRSYSEPRNDGYVYSLGSPVDVTTMKKHHSNALIAQNLSSSMREDRFMIRYSPTNVVTFSRRLMDSGDAGGFVSLALGSGVSVGVPGEFPMESGMLAFSGFLTYGNLVDGERRVYGNSRVSGTVQSRVRVLAVGLNNGGLFALYYIPSTRGLLVGKDRVGNVGVSVNTLKEHTLQGYSGFLVSDWFSGAKVVER